MIGASPSLPTLNTLPYSVLIDGGIGFIGSKLGQVNPVLMTTIFTLRAIAYTTFYLFAINIIGDEKRQAQKILIFTATVVNITFLIATRELNLIGRFFTSLLGLMVIGQLIHKVQYIEQNKKVP